MHADASCVYLVVLDSVGIGEAPDAAAYGDAGSNTLAHTAAAAGGLQLPVLQAMGLGCIPPLLPRGLSIRGVPPAEAPGADHGAMREVSRGKDTTTGHWEIAGLHLEEGFRVFPQRGPAFPSELVKAFEERTGRGVLGNLAASGTRIIEELGREQMETGDWIVYTSADSVFQIAAHEEVVPLPELYRGCETARDLCNAYTVGRVIARPYIGRPGAFRRTGNRRDYSYPLPEPSILDRLSGAGWPVITVGKLDDVFNHQGMTESVHVENSADAATAVLRLAARPAPAGLVFANLIDFDMLYGHRRDAHGYARALEQADAFLGELCPKLRPADLLIVTADHGNDPTFRGTDHTREFVPLLVWRPNRRGRGLGIRNGFYDVAQSLAAHFGLAAVARGRSFLPADQRGLCPGRNAQQKS